jgi:hypothetical protein
MLHQSGINLTHTAIHLLMGCSPRVLQGHTSTVNDIAFLPGCNGTRIITASGDRQVNDRELYQLYQEHRCSD